jgi:hypothetical protein
MRLDPPPSHVRAELAAVAGAHDPVAERLQCGECVVVKRDVDGGGVLL